LTDKNAKDGGKKRPGSGGRRRAGWLATHGRDLRFLVVFAALMVAYYASSTTSMVKDRFFPWYLTWSADVSGVVLRAVGVPVETNGKSLISKYKDGPKAAISVERGCDAVEPSALFVSAVMASPVPFLRRLSAAFIGTMVLMVLNLIRIMSLFLTAVFWHDAFDVMHLDVWQAAFIFFALVQWAVWAAWESRRGARASHVPG